MNSIQTVKRLEKSFMNSSEMTCRSDQGSREERFLKRQLEVWGQNRSIKF
jgi:hypothetical protein